MPAYFNRAEAPACAAELRAADFGEPQFEKFSGTPRFHVGEAGLRETLLAVRKPRGDSDS